MAIVVPSVLWIKRACRSPSLSQGSADTCLIGRFECIRYACVVGRQRAGTRHCLHAVSDVFITRTDVLLSAMPEQGEMGSLAEPRLGADRQSQRSVRVHAPGGRQSVDERHEKFDRDARVRAGASNATALRQATR
jgi:hypothetical protein